MMAQTSQSQTPKIRLRNVRKIFAQKKGEVIEAIRDLSFDVTSGEYVAIVGETGAGKSVLFDCMLGLKELTAGSIEIDGTPVRDYTRRRAGMVTRIFQEDRLLPWRTAAENAALGLQIRGMGERERLDIAGHWLDQVGLTAFRNAYPGELSGGMRQRVNIARAFATTPEVLLLDEAFSALDEVTATRLRTDFLALAHRQKTTFLMVTHSLDEALVLGDRILVFGAPARLVHEVRVTAADKADPERRTALKEEIRSWISRAGRATRQSPARAG
jgi:NitT/TauT family transport system ATP-binding protein